MEAQVLKVGRLSPESDLVDFVAIKLVGGGVDPDSDGQLDQS